MQLKNPFSQTTRGWWIDCWECPICLGNGQDCGGLELHHILGRESNAPFNAVVLCKKCHATIKHTQEEEEFLFAESLTHYYNQNYTPQQSDWLLIKNNKRLQNAIKKHKILADWISKHEENKKNNY